jgi:predicted RNase H-like HicB family nuclease
MAVDPSQHRAPPIWGIRAVNIEIEHEDDGRWIAEVPDLPGVMVYGQSREEAISKVKALALRVLADRLENGESVPELGGVFAVPA